MADANLTQAEADALSAMEKRCADEEVRYYPGLGGVVSVPLLSGDRREAFLLDVRRGPNRPCQGDVPEQGARGGDSDAPGPWRAVPQESGRYRDYVSSSARLPGRKRGQVGHRTPGWSLQRSNGHLANFRAVPEPLQHHRTGS